MKQDRKQDGLFSAILAPLAGTDALREEKARLEAFLDAMPGEYCGFGHDGEAVVFSKGFAGALQLDRIADVHDVQGALSTSDAAALEGQFFRLKDNGKPFTLNVQSSDKSRTFRLSGTRGKALDGGDGFDILWLEDITSFEGERSGLRAARDNAEKEFKSLQKAMDSLPSLHWMRGAHGDLIWCNEAYAAALALPPATVIAEQRELPLSGAGKGLSLKDMGRTALKSGQKQELRAHVIAGGSRILMQMSEQPLPGTDRTFGMARDLSREEELEAELKRHLTANRELLEQLRTAIGMFGPDQTLEFYNSAFAQLWGLEEQWLNKRPRLGDILEKLRETRRLPEQADFRKYKQSWLDMFTRLIAPHEDMLYLPDGSALRMLVVPHPMGGLMTTFEDVTSRLELESSYNTLIAVQKETLDNLAEAVAVYGGDGRLKLCNPAFARMWSFNPEDLDGEPHITKLVERMKSFFDDAEWAASRRAGLVAQALERSVQDGRMARADGALLEYATVPLPDGGVLVSYFDVTDSARVENALREKNAALEAAERLKLDFLANVSYQLRTPLNAIMGFGEILDNQYFGTLNDRQKEYTAGIQEAGGRLLSLIDDILDLSTIEAGYMDLRHENFDVRAMLEAIYTLTREWAGKQKLDVVMDCAEDAGTIDADERRIKQALLNLIRNAIAFTPEGGTITLSARREGSHLELAVRDTGVGIPEEDLARVLQPFERIAARSNDSAQRGAGLGLTLVKNIVELHGGTLDIDSAPGQGTRVTVRLPLEKRA